MGAPGRSEDSSLSRGELRRVLEEFLGNINFFQAVRLVELVSPDRQPVGRYFHPSREVVRFRAHNALAFPPSQVHSLVWRDSGPPEMAVHFMGLTGAMGVMPLVYTAFLSEQQRAFERLPLVERQRQKGVATRDFFDIFNHRMISLFYQAWEKYRFPIGYERIERERQSQARAVVAREREDAPDVGSEPVPTRGGVARDRLSHHLLDLIGLGTPGLQERQPVRDDALLYYTGLLSTHARSAASLENLLEDYFEVPVRVEQFIGRWYALELDTQCQLADPGSYSEQLGVGAVVGDEVWDQNSGVRIVLGPLSLAQYTMFLPNGSAHPTLRAITRFYGGGELDFEVQLILRREQVPDCELGSEGGVPPQLGWSTWAKTRAMGRDPGDAILRI